jgi:hypothetical protein
VFCGRCVVVLGRWVVVLGPCVVSGVSPGISWPVRRPVRKPATSGSPSSCCDGSSLLRSVKAGSSSDLLTRCCMTSSRKSFWPASFPFTSMQKERSSKVIRVRKIPVWSFSIWAQWKRLPRQNRTFTVQLIHKLLKIQ